MLIFQIEAAILVGYLHSYSAAQSDGFGVGLRLMNAVYSINVGLTVGAGVVTGNMIGAGSQTRLRSDTIIFVMAVMGASVILAASSAYWAETIARQFVTDENAVHFAVQFIQYALVANIAFAGAHVIIGAFEGRGMTLPVLISMLVAVPGATAYPLVRDDFATGQRRPAATMTESGGHPKQHIEKVRWCCQRGSNTQPHPCQGCAQSLDLWQYVW